MAKILMMAGSTVVVLSLLGFVVLLLKGRAVTKTSPVLMSLKALGIRPSEAEQRLCRQRVWVGNDTLMRGARRIRKKSYAKVFRASVRAETSRLPVCGSAARRNRRLG